MGGGPAGFLARLLEDRPGALRQFDDEGAAAVADERRDRVDQGLPVGGLALVQHAAYVHVHVAQLGVHRSDLTGVGRVDLPVVGLFGGVGAAGPIEGGGGQVGADDLRVAVGEEPGLRPCCRIPGPRGAVRRPPTPVRRGARWSPAVRAGSASQKTPPGSSGASSQKPSHAFL